MNKYTSLLAIALLTNCKTMTEADGPASAKGTLVVSPNPGDLSTVEGLKSSDDYVVQVRKTGEKEFQTCFVYKSLNTWKDTYFGSPSAPQTAVSFTHFSFKDTEVEVKIIPKFAANTVTIRPLSLGMTAVKNGNEIILKLASPKKIAIEINDKKNPLFLFADAPDVPNKNATYYYGPGVHRIGLQKVINSNQSVYIDAGAVVEGSFLLPYDTQNISIKGRGILTMGEWKHESTDIKWLSEHSAIRGNGTHHLQIEGITIANSCGWTIPIYNSDDKTHDNQFLNLKLVSWNGNTDGIWVNGNNNLVDDCFMFTNDDLIMSHGATNCKISNLVGWGGVWGRLYWGAGYFPVSNIVFENIDLIHKEGGPAVILVGDNNGTTLSNVTFKNLRIEDHPKLSSYNTNKFLVFTPGNKKVSNWLFENVTLDDMNPDEGDFYGNATGTIQGVTFKNLKIKGNPVKSLLEANMDKNEHAVNIQFN